MTPAAVPRRVAVELLSTQQELVHIIRVAVLIVLGVWLYLASALGDTSATRKNLLPYQTVIQNRPDADQRMFRELQEALLEAERERSTDGTWPEVPALADQGIPPFAIDPTAKNAAFRWQLLKSGTLVNDNNSETRSPNQASRMGAPLASTAASSRDRTALGASTQASCASSTIAAG